MTLKAGGGEEKQLNPKKIERRKKYNSRNQWNGKWTNNRKINENIMDRSIYNLILKFEEKKTNIMHDDYAL